VLHVTSMQKSNYYLENLVDYCDRRAVGFTVATQGGEGTFAEELRRRGISVYCLGCGRRSEYARAVRIVCAIIRRHNIDIVHTHLVEPTWIGLTAARLTARAAITTRHHSDAVYRVESLFKRWAYLRLEQCCRAMADHIIAPSTDVRRLLVDREGTAGSKVTVVPYGQDLRRFEAVTERGVAQVRAKLGMTRWPLLVCVSRLDRLKGHDYLFEAVSSLTDQFPGLSLYLVGEGPCRAQLERSAEAAGICRLVRFLGWRDDALEIMSAADLIVHPSLSEALSSVLIEAMALAKPVVACDVSGVRDTIEDYGTIVPPGDAVALAHAVRATLVSLENARDLAVRGKAHIFETMSAARTGQAHIDIYRQVLERRQP
jgi:glycosyltransferase involved in cell wall biosynthesis